MRSARDRRNTAAVQLVLHVLAFGAVTSSARAAVVVTAGVAICAAFARAFIGICRRFPSTRRP